jgi:hypothetical protein
MDLSTTTYKDWKGRETVCFVITARLNGGAEKLFVL